MFCKKCGNKLTDGGKFCKKCGTRVNSKVEFDSRLLSEGNEETKQKGEQNKKEDIKKTSKKSSVKERSLK